VTSPIPVLQSQVVPPEEAQYLEPTDMLGYLRLLFEPGDWINLQFIHQTEKWTDQRRVARAKTDNNYLMLEEALTEKTIQRVSEAQDKGWNSYVAMNAFTSGLKSRKEKDIAAIRSVYVEFDENTQIGLDRIDADIEAGIVPQNDFLLVSSIGKAYVIWRVKDFTVPQQRALNKALQERYGSDPQSVDAARVLRLPGTRNLKYEPNPIVVINNEGDHSERFTPADFKIEYVVPKPVNRAAAPEAVQRRMAYYEQACQDAGVDAGTLTAKADGSYNYIVACPNFEEHTTGGEFDASVWISPSGAISFGCFHSHCADKDWRTFYRPWLEQEARDNGFQGILKFGDASEVEDPDVKFEDNLDALAEVAVSLLETQSLPPTHDDADADVDDTAGETEKSRPALSVADIKKQLDEAMTGRELPWTHGAAADFFDILFGENYLYAILGKSGDWMAWNSHMWYSGNKAAMLKRMDNLLKRIRMQIIPGLKATDSEMLAVLRGLDKKCADASFMAGVMKMLEAKRLVEFEKFDPEGQALVNFLNGTLELETGNFRQSRREDMLTQTLAVTFMPDAKCPNWTRFLENSFPDADVREFLQRFFGYMLEGTGREKLAAFFHGYGDNGKTLLTAVLMGIFGYKSDNSYGKSVGWETLAENKSGTIRNDIARLHNARAVFCDESEQGMVLKESIFKALTGASPITSRFLHKEFFTFFSRFVFVLATNRLPRVIGGDGASWKRILKIPMTQSFPPGHPKRIENLRPLLMGEREGIAQWIVEGYRKYRASGLGIPQAIQDASAEYRENSDVIEWFLAEVCQKAEGSRERFDAVYARYSSWCREKNEKEQARDSLADILKAHEYQIRRITGEIGRPQYVYGLTLVPQHGRTVINGVYMPSGTVTLDCPN
jgi:putative DNA primase/helicase